MESNSYAAKASFQAITKLGNAVNSVRRDIAHMENAANLYISKEILI